MRRVLSVWSRRIAHRRCSVAPSWRGEYVNLSRLARAPLSVDGVVCTGLRGRREAECRGGIGGAGEHGPGPLEVSVQLVSRLFLFYPQTNDHVAHSQLAARRVLRSWRRYLRYHALPRKRAMITLEQKRNREYTAGFLSL